MAPVREILYISSQKDDDVDDDYCVILEEDPFEPVKVSSNSPVDASEELLIVAEKGQVVCRDFPHARHLCARYPFATYPHEKHCDMCHCYVCDCSAPCAYWGTGASSGDHCHSNDKADIWRQLRETFKMKKGENAKEAIMRRVLSTFSTCELVNKLTGIVKWFDTYKGYGFITPDNGGEELFVSPSLVDQIRGMQKS